jgi:hypothetical protein
MIFGPNYRHLKTTGRCFIGCLSSYQLPRLKFCNTTQWHTGVEKLLFSGSPIHFCDILLRLSLGRIKRITVNIYKVTVDVEGRPLEAFVRANVMANIETGQHVDKKDRRPEHKISLIVGDSSGKPAAWVQVASVHADGSMSILSNGWVSGTGQTTVQAVSDVPEKTRLALEKVVMGLDNCCTAHGNGCYVRCCNSCCSDPTRCPGASCCP